MLTILNPLSIVAFLSTALFALVPAAIADDHAESEPPTTVDLTDLTCRDLLLSEAEDEATIITFIQGYLSGQEGDIVINGAELRVSSDRSYEDCIDSPDEMVLSVFRRNRAASEE